MSVDWVSEYGSSQAFHGNANLVGFPSFRKQNEKAQSRRNGAAEEASDGRRFSRQAHFPSAVSRSDHVSDNEPLFLGGLAIGKGHVTFSDRVLSKQRGSRNARLRRFWREAIGPKSPCPTGVQESVRTNRSVGAPRQAALRFLRSCGRHNSGVCARPRNARVQRQSERQDLQNLFDAQAVFPKRKRYPFFCM